MGRVSLQTDERSNYKQVCATIWGKGEHTKCKNVKNITLQKFVYFFWFDLLLEKKMYNLPFKQHCCFFPHSLKFIYSLNQKLEEAQQEPTRVFQTSLSPTHCVSCLFLMLILYCCRGGLLFLILLQAIWCHRLFLTTFFFFFYSFLCSCLCVLHPPCASFGHRRQC